MLYHKRSYAGKRIPWKYYYVVAKKNSFLPLAQPLRNLARLFVLVVDLLWSSESLRASRKPLRTLAPVALFGPSSEVPAMRLPS